MSGRYQNVYLLRSDVRGDYLLRGHLYDLREIDGKALSVRVAFEFDLRDVKPSVNDAYGCVEFVKSADADLVYIAVYNGKNLDWLRREG